MKFFHLSAYLLIYLSTYLLIYLLTYLLINLSAYCLLLIYLLFTIYNFPRLIKPAKMLYLLL